MSFFSIFFEIMINKATTGSYHHSGSTYGCRPRYVTFIYQVFDVFSLSLDARASSLPVRLLPYSLVPGIRISSRPFLKAVSIITKQHESANIQVATRITDVPAASASVPKGKKKHNSGMSSILYNSLIVILNESF
jgi:hypothetical protein